MSGISEQLATAIAPLARQINNVVIDKLGGQSVQCLRITKVARGSGMSGGFTEFLESEILNNVIIKFPSNEFELRYDYDSTAQTLDTKSIDLFDLLDIEITVPFKINNNVNEIINLKRGDLVVIPIFDEYFEDGAKKNVVPILGHVQKLKGTFTYKQITHKSYVLSIYRQIPETAIKEKIDDFIAGLKQ